MKTQIASEHLPAGELRPRSGMTLLELLCVIAIIAIIAALYLGVIARAFIHVKRALGH